MRIYFTEWYWKWRYKELKNKIIWKVAYLLPRSIVLVCFVRVYSVLGNFSDDYQKAYQAFENGVGR